MNNELVSIIIPTHNAEKFVERCIDCIKKQTYSNYEVIIIDDGSTDNTVQNLKKSVSDDCRFKIYCQSNVGISATRNKGIGIAKGSYIVFVDIDDYVYKDYIEYLYSLIKKYNVEIVTCTHQSLSPGGKVKIIENPKDYIIKTEEYFKRLGDKTLPYQLGVAPWGRMYKKSLFREINFPEGRKFEDSATTYKLYMKAETTAIGEDIKYLYYRNENSIVQKPFTKDRLEFLVSEREMVNELTARYPKIRQSMKRRYKYALMNTLAHIVISPNSKEFHDEQLLIRNKLMKSFYKNLFDRTNTKKDVLGLVSLRLGLPAYKVAFKFFKKMQKKDLV